MTFGVFSFRFFRRLLLLFFVNSSSFARRKISAAYMRSFDFYCVLLCRHYVLSYFILGFWGYKQQQFIFHIKRYLNNKHKEFVSFCNCVYFILFASVGQEESFWCWCGSFSFFYFSTGAMESIEFYVRYYCSCVCVHFMCAMCVGRCQVNWAANKK